MRIIAAVQEMQIPLLSLMLLGGCITKIIRSVRVSSVGAGLGATALFPVRLRRPLALAMCALELGLGIGLIVTTGQIGRGAPATCVRLGTGLLFLVATCALLELRAARPDMGCGCFGDFSSAPVSWRTLTRSALLAVAALITIGLAPVQPPRSGLAVTVLLGIFAAELTVIGALSPELGEALVRLGYSEPCELRVIPADRTLAVLRRSKQWRRHAGLITADVPADVWRELCWRYLVFPARHGNQEADIVFGVYLRHRRPIIHTVLVDAATGRPFPWPAQPARSARSARSAGSGWAAGSVRAPGSAEPAGSARAAGQQEGSAEGSAGSRADGGAGSRPEGRARRRHARPGRLKGLAADPAGHGHGQAGRGQARRWQAGRWQAGRGQAGRVQADREVAGRGQAGLGSAGGGQAGHDAAYWQAELDEAYGRAVPDPDSERAGAGAASSAALY